MNGLRIPGWVGELALVQGEERTAAQPTAPSPHLERTDRRCGERVRAQQVAPQQRGPGPGRPGRGRGARSRSPSSFRRGGPAGPAPRTTGRPGACVPDLPAPRPLPAAAGAMALPAARARGWAAAVKMAQRRRHAEAPRGSPSRARPGSRAALYVHVSGARAELAGRRGGGPEPTWRLIAQGSHLRLSGPADESGTGRGAMAKKCPGSEI